MNAELEELMDFAVADGQLTDKEKQVLARKAIEAGVDMDEFEMVLNAKLYNAQEKIKVSVPLFIEEQSSLTEEDVERKCPSCGEPTKLYTLNCSLCGYEFREIKSNSRLVDFFRLIEKANTDERASIIANFPVPKSKEEVFEFLSQSLGNTKSTDASERYAYLDNAWTRKYNPELAAREKEIKAWQTKTSDIISQGKLLCNEDAHLMSILISYEKELKFNSAKRESYTRKSVKYFIKSFIITLTIIWALIFWFLKFVM